jgi:hypothetical protein
MRTKIQEQKFQKSRNKSKKNPGTKSMYENVKNLRTKMTKNLGTKITKYRN